MFGMRECVQPTRAACVHHRELTAMDRRRHRPLRPTAEPTASPKRWRVLSNARHTPNRGVVSFAELAIAQVSQGPTMNLRVLSALASLSLSAGISLGVDAYNSIGPSSGTQYLYRLSTDDSVFGTFVSQASGTVTSISCELYRFSGTRDFTISVRSVAQDAPGAVLASWDVSTTSQGSGIGSFVYTFAPTSTLDLTQGSLYAFVLTSRSASKLDVMISSLQNLPPSTFGGKTAGAAAWDVYSSTTGQRGQPSFAIAVPSIAGIAPLGLGLLVSTRRRR